MELPRDYNAAVDLVGRNLAAGRGIKVAYVDDTETCTYAQLAEAVWAVTTGPESNSLEVHISRIRQKLEHNGGSRLIQTVRGLGYRFSPE